MNITTIGIAMLRPFFCFFAIGGAVFAAAPQTGGSLAVPPEPRVPRHSFRLPESDMTLRTVAAIEAERTAPITDAQGRVHYIIDFKEEAVRGYSAVAPTGFSASVLARRFGNDHRPQMLNLVSDYESRYSLSATQLLSHVGNTFSAFLTPAQVEALKSDNNVERMTPNRRLQYSAIWSDSAVGAEVVPWGVNAVGPYRNSNGQIKVYVVDSGVQ